MDDDQVATHNPPAEAPVLPRNWREREFTELYLAELRTLVGFVIKLGATVEEAADVAQSTFELAWRDWASITVNRRAWLRTVATRTFFKLTPRDEMLTAEPPDLPVLLSPDVHIVIADQAARLRELLGRLSTTQAMVIAWKADGFSTNEIAESLNMSQDAVRQALHRGRENLKQMLEKIEGGAV